MPVLNLEIPDLTFDRDLFQRTLSTLASRTDAELEQSDDSNDWSHLLDEPPGSAPGRNYSWAWFDDLFLLWELHPELFGGARLTGHVVYEVDQGPDDVFVGVYPENGGPLVGTLVHVRHLAIGRLPGAPPEVALAVISKLLEALQESLSR